MAALPSVGNAGILSKAEYLKRYLGKDDGSKSKEKKAKKKRVKPSGKGMKIVDDDIDWKQLVNTDEKENQEEDEDEAPVVAEFIDERPEEIKCLEEFRTSDKWRVMGAASDDSQEAHEDSSAHSNREAQKKTKKASPRVRHDSPDAPARRSFRHDSPDLSPVRKARRDSPVRKTRHDSPDLSPVRKRHDSPPDVSPKRKKPDLRKEHVSSFPSSPAQKKHSSSSSTFSKKHKGSSPSRRKFQSGQRHDSDSDLSPRRRVSSCSPSSDLSPPRKRPHQKNKGSNSDLSPPRRSQHSGRNSDSDLSPPRRVLRRSPDAQKPPRMLSGGAAGLVSLEVLRREKEENRRRDKKNQPLEDESHNAKTVFRDKSGKRRDIEQEREEQRKRAGEQAEKDKKYAQWGKGLAQAQMQERNMKDAIKEIQKPLARYADDEDLDKMLREQEREGDPMAEMLRKKKEKDSQRKGVKEMPRYKGPPPPPNRFNIMPGYRWDGVDRSNGFEKQRYSRLAEKKAVQEMAYKWSVEDM